MDSPIQFACWCYSNESRKSNELNPKDGFALNSIDRMVIAKKPLREGLEVAVFRGIIFEQFATAASGSREPGRVLASGYCC